jgi:hypothetical protein
MSPTPAEAARLLTLLNERNLITVEILNSLRLQVKPTWFKLHSVEQAIGYFQQVESFHDAGSNVEFVTRIIRFAEMVA